MTRVQNRNRKTKPSKKSKQRRRDFLRSKNLSVHREYQQRLAEEDKVIKELQEELEEIKTDVQTSEEVKSLLKDNDTAWRGKAKAYKERWERKMEEKEKEFERRLERQRNEFEEEKKRDLERQKQFFLEDRVKLFEENKRLETEISRKDNIIRGLNTRLEVLQQDFNRIRMGQY